MIGRTISHYEIAEKLGEGGMGVVYKARDNHLRRFVALKVLPPERVADADRRQRFVQEARSASALNHPNIVTVHDIGHSDGIDFIVMEYVEGKTLDQLIGRNGLKLNDALKYGIQITDALAKAHSAGITHRDLKPGNVMITPDGRAKVLDFGLAKLTEVAPLATEDSTRTMRRPTQDGIIVGTVGYMSPEQAAGKEVDARSDIFSFGSLVYEMLTGDRAFKGDTPALTLAAVLNTEPPPLGPKIARDVAKVVEHCLRKDPDRRYQHIGDVKIALEDLKEDSDSGALSAGSAQNAQPARRWPWLAAVVIAITVSVVWFAPRWRSPERAPDATLTRLTYDVGLTTDPALSSDGKLLAYASDRAGAGNLDIWVQQVGGGEPVRLTRDAAEDREPSFSPDGTRIVFRSARDGGGIYVMPALGGIARKIAPGGSGPVFSPDGGAVAFYTGSASSAVLANASTQLFVVNPEGGAVREIRTGFSGACCPIWTPDGKHLLFLGNRDATLPLEKSLDWWVTPLDGGPAVKTGALGATRAKGLRGTVSEQPSALIPGAWASSWGGVVFSASYGDTTNLWQVNISSDAFQSAGEPRRLTTGAGFEKLPSVAALPDGRLRMAFASAIENRDVWSLPVAADQARVTGDLRRLTQNPAVDMHPALSPDGKKLAFISNRTGMAQVWIKDLTSGEESAHTFSPSEKYGPLFSRDGCALTYSNSGSGKWEIYISRLTGGEEILNGAEGLATSWTPDGNLIYHDIPGRVFLVDMASRRRTKLLDKAGHRLSARLSPDGHWIAFRDISAGSERIFVAPFRGPAAIEERDWRALSTSQSADRNQYWSPGGNVLYFLSARDGYDCIWAQRLEPVTKRPSGPAVAVYHAHGASSESGGSLTVAADRIAFDLRERTGNLWMAEWKAR